MARRCAAAVFLCAACGAFSPPSAARFSSPRRAAASTQSSPDVARVTSLYDAFDMLTVFYERFGKAFAIIIGGHGTPVSLAFGALNKHIEVGSTSLVS